jgi:phage terminase large subunit
MRRLLNMAADTLRRWRERPWDMVREEFKAEPDWHQMQLLRAFANTEDPRKQQIAEAAAKGPGKTTGLSWCGWNFMACYGTEGSHPNGAAVSTSKDNLKDNLWKEMAKWRGHSDYFQEAFEMTDTRIFAKEFPKTWFLSARSYSKKADKQQQSDTLSGLHSDFILFLLDESGSMPRALMATAQAGLANANRKRGTWAKIVQAGNPTSLDGPLYDAVKRHRKEWYVIRITGDPTDPRRAKRISKRWARQQIRMYGRDNPWVQVNVFGNFPPQSLNALLGPDEVERAMRLRMKPEDYEFAQRRLGIDVARFGDDRSVLFPRQGLMAFKPTILRHMRTDQIAARAMLFRKKWRPQIILVDDTGHWGHGVVDNLIGWHVPNVIPVTYSDPAFNPRYANRRTEGWIEMAEWVKRGGALPNIDEIVPELTEPTYSYDAAKEALILEPKKMIKERLGYSPDLADALAQTFMLPEDIDRAGGLADLPRGVQDELEDEFAGHVSDWDPLEEAFA